MQKIIQYTVSSYNKQLVKIFSSKEYENKVTLLPVATSLNNLAKEKRFSDSVSNGLTCVDNIPSADSANPNINNCNYDDTTRTYFAWNNSHLSTVVNQFMAYKVSDDMSKQNLLTLDSDDSHDQKNITNLLRLYKKYTG